jgi:hypothetical protein
MRQKPAMTIRSELFRFCGVARFAMECHLVLCRLLYLSNAVRLSPDRDELTWDVLLLEGPDSKENSPSGTMEN